MKQALLFILVLVGFPVILTLSLNLPVFQFASGQVDSWIAFWGSYIGAIIGASAVYFVAKFQIQKQHEKQLSAIDIENKYNSKREMEQFLITTKLEKYEETIEVIERLSQLLMKMSNEFVEFVTYTDIINNREDPIKEEELKEKVYMIKSSHRNNHEAIMYNVTKLNILANYSSEIEKDCAVVITNFNNIWVEAKECYLSKNEYRKYVKPNDKLLLKHSKETLDLLTELIHYFNDKISNQLVEIERKTVR